MRYILCILILIIPLYALVIPNNSYLISESKIEDIYNQKNIKLLDNSKIIDIPIEEYIVGVVACEMPASYDLEALKAQAVASRTYALSKMKNTNKYDLENSTSDQCYINTIKMKEKWGNSFQKYYNKIEQAVKDTSNAYMTYNNIIIKALYFSTSNGYTEDVEDVFGEKLDYLVSVESPWDKNSKNFEKQMKINELDFLKKLNLNEQKIKSIEIQKNKTGRADYVLINNIKIKGTDFRKKLNLRSTDMEISMSDNVVYIKTKGYGHGVGLSQYGANEMAKLGYSYDEILKYYYKDIEINNV